VSSFQGLILRTPCSKVSLSLVHFMLTWASPMVSLIFPDGLPPPPVFNLPIPFCPDSCRRLLESFSRFYLKSLVDLDITVHPLLFPTTPRRFSPHSPKPRYFPVFNLRSSPHRPLPISSPPLPGLGPIPSSFSSGGGCISYFPPLSTTVGDWFCSLVRVRGSFRH